MCSELSRFGKTRTWSKLEFDVALMSRLYKCKNRLRNYFCVAPPARQIFFSNSVAAIFGFSRSTELVLGKYNFCLCICMNQRSESIFLVKEITIYWNSVFNWALDILHNLDNPKTCFTKYVHNKICTYFNRRFKALALSSYFFIS